MKKLKKAVNNGWVLLFLMLNMLFTIPVNFYFHVEGWMDWVAIWLFAWIGFCNCLIQYVSNKDKYGNSF